MKFPGAVATSAPHHTGPILPCAFQQRGGQARESERQTTPGEPRGNTIPARDRI